MTIFSTPLVLFSLLLLSPSAPAGDMSPGIVLQLTDPSGSVVRVTVRPRETATFSRPGLEPLWLRPDMPQDGRLGVEAGIGEVPASVFDSPAGSTHVSIPEGTQVALSLGDYTFDVRWSVSEAEPPTVAATQQLENQDGSQQCCVTCQGITTCGRIVETPCGNCDASKGGATPDALARACTPVLPTTTACPSQGTVARNVGDGSAEHAVGKSAMLGWLCPRHTEYEGLEDR